MYRTSLAVQWLRLHLQCRGCGFDRWWGFPCSSVGKESAFSAGELGSIPRSGRSPGEGNGNPLQYSCLENPIDRGAWQATVRGVTRVRQDLVAKPSPPPQGGQIPHASRTKNQSMKQKQYCNKFNKYFKKWSTLKKECMYIHMFVQF